MIEPLRQLAACLLFGVHVWMLIVFDNDARRAWKRAHPEQPTRAEERKVKINYG